MIIINLCFISSFQSEMMHPPLAPQTKQITLAGAANEGLMTKGAFVSPVPHSRTAAQSVPDISRRKHDGGFAGGGGGE